MLEFEEITLPENDEIIQEIETENEQVKEPEITEPKPEIKRGRGRHKKDCNCEKCIAKREGKKFTEKVSGNNYEIPTDLLDEYEEITPAQTSEKTDEKTETNSAKYINGYILLILINILFPIAFSFIGKKMGKKNATVKKLQMSKEERNELRELADEAAKELAVNMNPVTLFLIVSGVMYGGKLMEVD